MPPRRLRTKLAALAMLLLATAAGAAGDAFLAGFGDLPLMKGLAAVPESETVFDTPAGRIVEAYAAGEVSRESAESFYRRSLPQLGWRRQKANVYQREEETLAIEFTARGNVLTIRFMLSPAGASR